MTKSQHIVWHSDDAVIDGYGPHLAAQMRAGELVYVCGLWHGVKEPEPEPVQLEILDYEQPVNGR